MSDRRSRPAPPEPLLAELRARLADAPLAIAVWTGFAAAALSCLVTIGVALLLWIPDADATATSSSIVHAGVITFLLSLHGGGHLNGVHIGFVPLGITAAALAACIRIARPAWAHPHAATVSAARLVGAQAAAYTVTCALLIPSARLGTTWLGWTGTLAGAAVLALLGFGVGALRAGGWNLSARVPAPVREAGRAAAAAMAVLLAGGALLGAGATILQHGRFTALSRALAGGVSSLPIALLQTLTAPNAVIAGSAYLAGPGFDVGAAHYALGGSRPAAVPAFPLLSGLPRNSSTAPVQVVVLAAVTVVGAGLVTGWLAHRGTRTLRWRTGVGVAALAALFAGAVMATLSALAGGTLGGQALRSVGPSPLWTGLAVATEIGVVAVMTGLVARVAGALRTSRATPVAATPATSASSPAVDTTVDLTTVTALPARKKAPVTATADATPETDDLPTAAAS